MESEKQSCRVWESPDFSVTKIVHQEGDRSQDRPRFGATCQVELQVLSCSGITKEELTQDFYNSKYFNETHSGEFQIGNADSEIDKTLEQCIQSMFVGEQCEAAMRVKLDLKKNRRTNGFNVNPGENELFLTIECMITLKVLLNAQPIFKWYPETKFEKAKEANAAAIRLFKLQRYLDAFHKFQSALTLLTYVLEQKDVIEDPDIIGTAKEMRLTCFSNLAACQFQWGNHKYVVELASKVLAVQPDNVKLLYRRGVSFLEMKDFELAKADLVEAHRLDPSNKAINDKLGSLRVLEKKHKEQIASGMKKMFG